MNKNHFCLIVIFLFGIVKINAQQTQVAFDNENTILTLDAELNKKYNIITHYNNFDNAIIFKTADTTYQIIVYTKNAGLLEKYDFYLTQTKYDSLRNSVSEKLHADINRTYDHSGRTLFLAGTTTHGLALHGWVAPFVLNINNERLAIGTYMLISGAGFLLPYQLTKHENVTYANANASIVGQTRGLVHGILLTNNLAIDDRLLVFNISFLSIAEGYLFYKYSKWNNLSVGDVLGITCFSDFTAAASALVYFSTATEPLIDQFSLFTIGGAMGGAVLGRYVTSKVGYSGGDAIAGYGLSFIGGNVGATIAVLTDSKDYRVYTSSIAAGMSAGLAGSYFLARKSNFTTSQGVLINLAAFSGAGLAMGTSYLIFGNEIDFAKNMLVSSSIGAIAGFGLMTNVFDKSLWRKQNKSDVSYNFSFNPLAVAMINNKNLQSSSNTSGNWIPMMNFSLKF